MYMHRKHLLCHKHPLDLQMENNKGEGTEGENLTLSVIIFDFEKGLNMCQALHCSLGETQDPGMSHVRTRNGGRQTTASYPHPVMTEKQACKEIKILMWYFQDLFQLFFFLQKENTTANV